MIYLNSLKITFNNLSTAFKSLLYKLIALLISCAIVFAIAFKPLQALNNQGVFDKIWEGLTNFNILGIFETIASVELRVVQTFKVAFATKTLFFSLIGAVAVGYILFLTLINMDKIALCDVLDAKMGSNCKLGFLGMFFSDFGKSLKYTLCSIIFFLPLDMILLVALHYTLKLFTLSGLWLTIAPFVVILVAVLLLSLRLCLYSSWVPAIVCEGKGVWKAFGKNVKLALRKFVKNFANSALIVLTVLFINVLVFVLTAGVGLFVTIPATVLLINGFSMVNYYVLTGNRFYVDAQRVVAPKKLETEEKLDNLIDLV